jgi:hypothetical protein
MENVVRRAVLYCHRGVLTTQDLPSSIREMTAREAMASEHDAPALPAALSLSRIDLRRGIPQPPILSMAPATASGR